MSAIPAPFLFRYALPVERVEGLPLRTSRRGGKAGAGRKSGLLDLPPECALGNPSAEFGRGNAFGELRLAWNDAGFGLSVQVAGKKMPLACGPARVDESDGLQVWIDTRNTQSIHRASRYCHHFALLPAGSGRNGREPTVTQLPIARAREDAPAADLALIAARSELASDGYLLEVWFPAETLNGYDPEASPRLGFYYLLRDAELGEQFLVVGSEFPYAHDPSVWSTLELVR